MSKIAQKIIKDNIYLSLATTEGNKPWIAPLYYITGANGKLYFVSEKNSRHARQLKKNPSVAISIFDSGAKPEVCNGIQMSAIATQVPKQEIKQAINAIYRRPESELLTHRFVNYRDPLSYQGGSPFRIYEILPISVYVLDPTITKRDKRVKVRWNS